MQTLRSIVLKKQDRGEADELVTFFSRELGWLTGVAKNSRRSRVRFGGHLEPLSLVDLTVRARKKDTMVWVDEAQVIKWFGNLRGDISRVAQAVYFLEISALFLPEATPDESLFDFLLALLVSLDQGTPSPVPLILWEIKLLGLLGFGPHFGDCLVCTKPIVAGQEALFSLRLGGVCHPVCLHSPETKRFVLSPDTLAVVRRGLALPPEAASRLRLSKKGTEELRAALHEFVRYLRGEEIKSLRFLEMMQLTRE